MSKKSKSCSHLKAVPSIPGDKSNTKPPAGYTPNMRPVFTFMPYTTPVSDLMEAIGEQKRATGRLTAGLQESAGDSLHVIRGMRMWSAALQVTALAISDLIEIIEANNVVVAETDGPAVYFIPGDDAAEATLMQAVEEGLLGQAECPDCGEPALASYPSELDERPARRPMAKPRIVPIKRQPERTPPESPLSST